MVICFEMLVRMDSDGGTRAEKRSRAPKTAQGIRERNRAAIESEILAIAKRHLTQVGAPALSLRSIAKELEMTPSALYRYIENRDELLTRLIVESFTSLSTDVTKAEARVDRSDFEGRFRALATSLRKWALAKPHEFGLIYGTPVPGFKASPTRTLEAGTRVFLLLARLGADMQAFIDQQLHKSGKYMESTDLLDTAAVEGLFTDYFDFLQDVSPELIMNVLAAWNLIMGGVSAEVFGHYGPDVAGAHAMFDAWVDRAWRVAAGGLNTHTL
ncbi:TetR/AcrR family transcriptional regulator [Neomicrococcus aestuarii]